MSGNNDWGLVGWDLWPQDDERTGFWSSTKETYFLSGDAIASLCEPRKQIWLCFGWDGWCTVSHYCTVLFITVTQDNCANIFWGVQEKVLLLLFLLSQCWLWNLVLLANQKRKKQTWLKDEGAGRGTAGWGGVDLVSNSRHSFMSNHSVTEDLGFFP